MEKSNQAGYVGGLWVSESLGLSPSGRTGLTSGSGPAPVGSHVLTVGTSKEMEKLFTNVGSSVCEGEGMRTERLFFGDLHKHIQPER